MYSHNKNNMRHFCITNKKKSKNIDIHFGQWVFYLSLLLCYWLSFSSCQHIERDQF